MRSLAGPIALLTDFGWAGHFAGVMKAVILGIYQDARILDITHDIPPQAVEEGAFTLGAVVPFLPAGSICVAVVDPGVGTSRRPIAIETEQCTFIGPDNGLLSAALSDHARNQSGPIAGPGAVALPLSCRAVHLSDSRYFHLPVSDTFHGRDIFAPVAAHIALGVPFEEFGEPIRDLLAYPPWRASRDAAGTLVGRILSVDSFGNLVTDIRASDLPDGEVVTSVGGREVSGLSRSYQAGPEFASYVGSSGYLEIGRRNSNAAAALNVGTGDPVLVRSKSLTGSARLGFAD